MGENPDDEASGLKVHLEERETQLDEIISKFDRKFNSLIEQIEGLLPGATSAGLATAYTK
jgi:DNA anti-recombination protein RmuC